jgi:hypothetical protein
MIMNNSVVVAQEDEVGGRRVMLLELLELHLCQCGCHRGICEEGGVCQRAWGLISALAVGGFVAEPTRRRSAVEIAARPGLETTRRLNQGFARQTLGAARPCARRAPTKRALC